MTSQTRQGSGHDWDDARKAALFADIVSLKLSIDEAAALHGLRVDVIQEWLRLFRRSALVAFDERLKKTLIDQGANADALTAAEFTGHVEDVSIADLVQTIEIAGKDAVITVTHEGTDSKMWCSAGAIIDAESGRLCGEAAVYRILAFERGRMVADLRPEQRARTIYAATHRLLLEAMRRKDESAQLERKLGNINRFYRLGERSTSSRVRVSTDELSLLRLFDGPRRLRDVLAQSHIGDLESLTALARLVDDGYLVENDAAPQPPRSANDVRPQRSARAMVKTERLDPAKRCEALPPRPERPAPPARRNDAPTRRDVAARADGMPGSAPPANMAPAPPSMPPAPRAASAARTVPAPRDDTALPSTPPVRSMPPPRSMSPPRNAPAPRSAPPPRVGPPPLGAPAARSAPPPRNMSPPPRHPRSVPTTRGDAPPRSENPSRGDLALRETAPRNELPSRAELGFSSEGGMRTDDPTPRNEGAATLDPFAHVEAKSQAEAKAQAEAKTRSEATARSEASTLPPLSKRARAPGDPVAGGGEVQPDPARREVGEGTHAATSFVPISVSKQPERRLSRWLLGALAALVLAPAAFWIGESLSNLRAARRAHAAANVESRTAALDVVPTLAVSTRVEPASAEIWLDRHPVATGQLGIMLPKDGSTHELRVAADGYIPVTLLFADVPPPKVIRLEALPAGAAPSDVTAAASSEATPSAELAAAATPTSAATSAAAGTPAASAARAGAREATRDGAGPIASNVAAPAAPKPAPRAARPAPRPNPAPKRRASTAATLGADTTPDAAARVLTPAQPPAPQVQIIDEGGPKVRVIE